MILNYNMDFRCSLYFLYFMYSTHSKGHRLSGSLLWDYRNISKFWGVGPNFHNINESKQPWFTTCIAMNSFSLQRNVTGNITKR